MTVSLCVGACQKKGFVYAGVQASFQCFCGDNEVTDEFKVDEDDCDKRCIGDVTTICGGDWRNSVYKTGNKAPTIAKLPGYEYVGCYRDQSDPRLLRGDQHFPDTLTPQLCIDFCKRKNYIYAGVQASFQCFCGDKVKDDFKVDEKDCNMTCTGNRTQICGGNWRNSVYKTGNKDAILAVTDYEYVGCYRDQAEPRLLTGAVWDYPETLTVPFCVGVCQKKGYVYAGVQASFQCFCGDNEVTDDFKVDEDDCDKRCTGDVTTICGGYWRNSVYKTGNKAPTIAKLPGYEYVGCYRDQASPRLLRGGHKDFSDTLTPQLCIDFCKRKNFIYAGVQASSQCFCGDGVLPDSAKISDGDCSAKCTGDRSVFCGGARRSTIYKTGKNGSSVANIGYRYMGCYIDISYPRKFSGFLAEYLETLTPLHCVTVCKQKKFLFAGLQAGFQCFCGNENPLDNDKKPESDCNWRCTGDVTAICGAGWRNTVYSTTKSNDNNLESTCYASLTIVNGKVACENKVVFEDNFESLSPEKWRHTIQIANEPDYGFVIYDSDPANAYISSGKLVIKPTLLPDTEVLNGDLHLENCTGKPSRHECGYKAVSYSILPPVKSAYLTTRKSFSFRYGKVEISAKLPAGDWLVPEIWLEPKNEVYGPGYASGRIRIAMSRGNKDLKLDGQDIGCKQLETGILMGVGNTIRRRTIIRETADGWYNNYHNYSLLWTPENIVFMIDGEQPYPVVPKGGQTLSAVLGFTPDVTASKIAPFDKDFYVSLGVSAGGVRNFPDNVINNEKPKPWKNLELKALLNFWRDKSSWQSTWSDDTSLLQVDYIKVTAL